MTKRKLQPPQRFSRNGYLAVDPKAFFELFMVAEQRTTERVGTVDVIEISGPLVQRDEMWCDSYEAIRERFRLACEGDARAIVLRFDSPGGDASGCFETARALRAEATKAGKPLFAYVDRACSAAYALATAATHGIAIGDTCCAGSVGVIASRPDFTAQNSMQGVRMAFITSGTRKLDGNPDVPINEAELAATQKHVDRLAGKFFALIGDTRAQLTPQKVASFDGGVFYGDEAVSVGLADVVATFDELLAIASGGDSMTLQAKSDYDAARAQLEKVAKGSDANAAAAKRALSVMSEADPEAPPDDEEKIETEGDDEEPAAADDSAEPDAASDEAEPGASDEGEPIDKKPKSEAGAASAQAAGSSAELTLAAQVHRMRAEMDADKERRTRKALIAKRPDFGPELKAALSKAPLATVREMVKTLPRGKVAAGRGAPITTVAATRSHTQGEPSTSARSTEAAALDRAMGLSGTKLGCRKDGATLYFGVVDASEDKQTNGAA